MNIIIRAETQEDYFAVEQIHKSAFRTDAESKVVNAIRANGNAVISLVAIKGNKVAGHILFSPVSTHPPTPEKGLGLAPVAVLPEFHSQGIGSALIRAGLEECRKLGYDYAVVLGGPKYYMRFGFEKASSFGLQNEYGLVKYTLEFGLFSV